MAMVPVNAAVGAVSSRLSDRLLVLASLALCAGCLLALTAGAAGGVAFFVPGVLLFVGTVVLEGTATSLMVRRCGWVGVWAFCMGTLVAKPRPVGRLASCGC